MENIICIISIGRNSLDDDYTFFKNGDIERFYDNDYYRSQNKCEMVKAEDISSIKKQRIIENCPVHFLEKVSNILNVETNKY